MEAISDKEQELLIDVEVAQEPDSGVWRYSHAERAHVIVDAEAYFEHIRDAMTKAQQRIFLIGWDFDTRVKLSGGTNWVIFRGTDRYPARLGSFVMWLAKRTSKLEVRILKWKFSYLKSLFRGSMILDLMRWAVRPRIYSKFDSAHPVGCSHHQKIVVIDDRLAVCGGIDLTANRWDTRSHLDNDTRRLRFSGGKYSPWHDVAMIMEGDAAKVLGELGQERWKNAGGRRLEPCQTQAGSPWPDNLVAEFENVEIGISRTRAAYGEYDQVHEIETLFIEQIAAARHFVYAEAQYFASRKVAEAIQARLEEPDPPEFVIVQPLSANGWLQRKVMDSARERLIGSLMLSDHAGRLHCYVPHTNGGAPIYVHSKLTIIDDMILRVGSANWNNRSMGLDSECDVFLDARRPANSHIVPAISKLRYSLLAEHCGIAETEVPAMIDRHGSMSAMIAALPREGRHLAPFVLQGLSKVETALADGALLDPERPEDWFKPAEKKGLFRKGGRLRRPGRLKRQR